MVRRYLVTFIMYVIYIKSMIPDTNEAHEKIKLTCITEPAIKKLHEIMNMIPNVLIGVALILAGIWLGKVIGGFVHNYLQKLGFDRLTRKMNIGSKEASAKLTPRSEERRVGKE